MIRGARSFWSSFSSEALDWLYPPQCPLCTRLGERSVCEACKGEMLPSHESPLEPPGSPLDFRASAYLYEGRAAQAVKRLKYSRATALAAFMAERIYAAACERDLLDARIVVPVPIHWTRRCLRGFNQADLLAERFPADSVHRALVRAKATPPQASLSLERRQRNLVGAFEAPGRLQGTRVLLIDDVVTSGHTARECARALKASGALEVGVLTFAGEAPDVPS